MAGRGTGSGAASAGRGSGETAAMAGAAAGAMERGVEGAFQIMESNPHPNTDKNTTKAPHLLVY